MSRPATGQPMITLTKKKQVNIYVRLCIHAGSIIYVPFLRCAVCNNYVWFPDFSNSSWDEDAYYQDASGQCMCQKCRTLRWSVWGCQVVRKAVRWEATHVPQSPLFHTFHNYTRSTITIVWSLPLMFFLQACVVCWWWKFSDEVWMRSSSPSRRRWNGNCQRETQQFVQGGGEEHKTLENVWPTRK